MYNFNECDSVADGFYVLQFVIIVVSFNLSRIFFYHLLV